jgi:hypothetical protein
VAQALEQLALDDGIDGIVDQSVHHYLHDGAWTARLA